MYQVKKISRTEFVPVRNLSYHVRICGELAPDKTPLVVVHGWMAVAESYQFMVDALAHSHYVIAPYWRGYGLTPSGGVDNFWFPDYPSPGKAMRKDAALQILAKSQSIEDSAGSLRVAAVCPARSQNVWCVVVALAARLTRTCQRVPGLEMLGNGLVQ